MASTKLHIEGGPGRPKAIKSYIDLIDQRSYDSASAVMEDAYLEFNITRPDSYDQEVNIKNMTTTLSKLGLVEDNNRQRLTSLGEEFVDIIIYNEDAFYPLFHLLYSTAYHRSPRSGTAISWSYHQISDEYRKMAPIDFSEARQDAVEAVMNTARRTDDPGISNTGPLSKRSLNSYKRFISNLKPAVIDDDGHFHLRNFASKELVLGAIDALYRSDQVHEALRYGDLLGLDGASEFLCTVLFVAESELPEVIEHTASMDGRLSIESDYSIRMRLTEVVDFDDHA